MRAALYARFSTDMQNERSCDDQLSALRRRAAQMGFTIACEHMDRARSGASMIGRSGLQALLEAARGEGVDIVMAEALDRLSRDQEDIAGIYKRLIFAGVRVFTLEDGWIEEMHIGLKGTFSALQLKQIREKTRRGLYGVVESGRAAAAPPFGYALKPGGAAGELAIDPDAAETVRAIYARFLAGESARAIATRLNADGVTGPRGSYWKPTSINGDAKRGTGILRNPIYKGLRLWNRQSYVRDPDTGKRIARFNPESEWLKQPAPELAIVSEADFDAVQARFTRAAKQPLGARKRRPSPLSGLVYCGQCGARAVVLHRGRLQCSARRNGAACTNARTIAQDDVMDRVLAALARPVDPGLLRAFAETYAAERRRLARESAGKTADLQRELTQLKRQCDQILDMMASGAIPDGAARRQAGERLDKAATRRETVEAELAAAQRCERETADGFTIHDTVYKRWADQLARLQENLRHGAPDAAGRMIAPMISKITLTPDGPADGRGAGALAIDIAGDLAAMLTLAENAKDPGANAGASCRSVMVAGAGFEPATFRL